MLYERAEPPSGPTLRATGRRTMEFQSECHRFIVEEIKSDKLRGVETFWALK
jgi:hypothetical protein